MTELGTAPRREARCDLSGFTVAEVREVLALARVPIDAEISRVQRALKRCASIDEDDLRSIGQIAALEAKKKFDPARGVMLRSWIGSVVRWRISEAVKRAGDRASVEVSVGGQIQLDNDPERGEGFAWAGTGTPASRRHAEGVAARFRSRTTRLSEEARTALTYDPTEAYELASVRAWVLRSLRGLTPRQKILLTQRIANNDESDARLAETLGVNKAQVCRDLDVAIKVLQSRIQSSPRDVRRRLLELFQTGEVEAACV